MNRENVSAKLDWNRLLGFDQIVEHRPSIRNETTGKLEAKVGAKVGNKLGVKIGAKLGLKA
ncbi:MAG TPA: hypothetical protein VM913_06600 [Sphingomicrobium sp.]|jgi:hypothetical protein|nr:hypothetical protein [Sphingomicrobium sp.]